MKEEKYMWRADYYGKPEKAKVVAVTKCFVTYVAYDWHNRPEERRVSRDGFFDTFEELKANCISLADAKMRQAQATLDRAKDALSKAKNMEEPK